MAVFRQIVLHCVRQGDQRGIQWLYERVAADMASNPAHRRISENGVAIRFDKLVDEFTQQRALWP